MPRWRLLAWPDRLARDVVRPATGFAVGQPQKRLSRDQSDVPGFHRCCSRLPVSTVRIGPVTLERGNEKGRVRLATRHHIREVFFAAPNFNGPTDLNAQAEQ
jgi:hypothetical protein